MARAYWLLITLLLPKCMSGPSYEPPKQHLQAEQDTELKGRPYALDWLVKHQQEDGGWSFAGNFPNPGTDPSRVKATALALLAFEGTGHTVEGPEQYRQVVKRGVEFLGKQFREQADGRRVAGADNNDLASHAMATLAISDMYRQTRNRKLKPLATGLLKQLLHLQDPQTGRWPEGDAPVDPDHLVWPTAALVTAADANLPCPEERLERSRALLEQRDDDKPALWRETQGMLGFYFSNGTVSGSVTEAYEAGIELLEDSGGTIQHDCTLDCLVKQAMEFHGGQPRVRWIVAMRPRVIDAKQQDGSWFDPRDRVAQRGGRLYQTAMNALLLENRALFPRFVERRRPVTGSLDWLDVNQQDDGGWSFAGDFPNTGTDPSRVKATALATLSFASAGHSHRKPGFYLNEVANGLRYLKSQFREVDGRMVNLEPQPDTTSHAIATFAVSELYGMTKDPELKPLLLGMLKQLRYLQDTKSGGWPDVAGKVSLEHHIWPMLALASANFSKFNDSNGTFERGYRFLEKQRQKQGLYTGADGKPALWETSQGLLCWAFGHGEPDLTANADGFRYIFGHGYDPNDCTFNYVATQVAHHAEGTTWEDWNAVARDAVVNAQQEDGSWFNPDDQYAAAGGRLYQTALNTYLLAIYYRHMPIYSSIRGPMILSKD